MGTEYFERNFPRGHTRVRRKMLLTAGAVLLMLLWGVHSSLVTARWVTEERITASLATVIIPALLADSGCSVKTVIRPLSVEMKIIWSAPPPIRTQIATGKITYRVVEPDGLNPLPPNFLPYTTYNGSRFYTTTIRVPPIAGPPGNIKTYGISAATDFGWDTPWLKFRIERRTATSSYSCRVLPN